MPTPPYRPSQLVNQIFRGSEAIAAGVLTPRQLRSRAWRRIARDVYIDSRTEVDHEIACRAAALHLPADSAFAGPSAAYLLGVPHAAEFGDPVHVVVPAGMTCRSRNGVHVHHVSLEPADVVAGHDLAHTSPVRTVWDLASWLPVVHCVPIIDSLIASGLVSKEDAERYVLSRRGERGWLIAAQALALADPRAQSPQESRLRVRLVQAGLPAPVPQFPVCVGGIILHPDLAWPEYKVAAEYDGLWHATEEQFHRDRRRLNLLVAEGWLIIHVTSERQRRDFGGIVRETRQALMSRGWRP